MRKAFSLSIPPLVMMLLCTPAPREERAAAALVIPSVNERIWVAPLIDKCELEQLPGRPRDSVEKSILKRQFDEISVNLLAEFRRCEKFGLYQTVDDSLRATMRVFVTLFPGTLTRDTLTLPVTLHVESKPASKRYDATFYAVAPVPATERETNPFHYAGILQGELCTSFPYRKIVYLFYSPMK